MTLYLRQSTASQEIPLGYFISTTDGITGVTDLTIANTDIKVWKAGATSVVSKNSGGATHMAGGIYYCTLDATDTNTLGSLMLFCHMSGALVIRQECIVLSQNVYDTWCSTGSLDVNVTTIAAGAITAAAIATDAIDADAIKADAVTEIQSGLATASVLGTVSGNVTLILEDTGTTLPATLTTIDDFLDTEVAAILAAVDTEIAAIKVVTDAIGTTGTGLSAIPWNAAWDAEVQSECTDALNAYDAPTKAEMDTGLDALPTAAEIKTAIEIAGGSIASILADTNELQTDWVNGGRLDLLVDSVKVKTELIPASPASVGSAMTLSSGAITAAVIATGAIDADALSTDAIAEIADGIWDEVMSGHATAGTTGKTLIDIIEDTSSSIPTTLDTIDNFLDTEIAAILADTNELQTDWANGGRLDLLLDGASAPSAAAVADAVWDEVLSGHLGVGSTGNALATASSGGVDPSVLADAIWDEALSGHFAAGTAGKAVTDILEDTGVTIPASLAAIDDYIDTEVSAILTAVDSEVAAIKAKTDNLPLDPAIQSTVESAITAAHVTTNAKIDAVDDFIDTEVAAIKAKTDLIPADIGSVPTLAEMEASTILAKEASITTIDGIVDAIKLKTDLIPADIASLPTLAEFEASTVIAKEATLVTINASVGRVLGLSMENYRIKNPVYTSNQMTSATIVIYGSKADATNDVNPLATYTLTSTYTGDDMATFLVVKE